MLDSEVPHELPKSMARSSGNVSKTLGSVQWFFAGAPGGVPDTNQDMHLGV